MTPKELREQYSQGGKFQSVECHGRPSLDYTEHLEQKVIELDKALNDAISYIEGLALCALCEEDQIIREDVVKDLKERMK